VFPDILPPPLTILQLPPPGDPVSVFVDPSQIDAVLVVFDATPGDEFTVNVRLLLLDGQAPFAGIVYLTVTFVFDATFGGVYVVPDILPPPLTILHVPPPGVPDKAFVLVSHIEAVLVVLLAVPNDGFTVNVLLLVVAGQAPLAGMVYLIVTLVFDATLAGV